MVQVADDRCPICDSASAFLDQIDFNKGCNDKDVQPLPAANIPIRYVRCETCGFCFAPELYAWTLSEFEEKIYNKDYVKVDPDYIDARPRNSARTLATLFGAASTLIKHLDYGSGQGLMSALLRSAGWSSEAYDPFVNKTAQMATLGKFDLVTAFEVFEHVPDVNSLFETIGSLLKPDGIVLFSTLTSDGHIFKDKPFDWWYAAPRNGHISLFSADSLAALASKFGFQFGSLNGGNHILWKKTPPWAAHVILAATPLKPRLWTRIKLLIATRHKSL